MYFFNKGYIIIVTSKAAPIGPSADKDEIPKTISCNTQSKFHMKHYTLRHNRWLQLL